MALQFGEVTYRDGALERLGDAWACYRQERYGGSVYLAGRAVEGMLRCLLYLGDSDLRSNRRSLAAGHGLHELLRQVAKLGLLDKAGPDRALCDAVQAIAQLWSNDLRYADESKVKQWWASKGEVRGSRTVPTVTDEFLDKAELIIRRSEQIWQSRRKRQVRSK